MEKRQTKSHLKQKKNTQIVQEELIFQLTKIIDQLDINEIGIKKQFEEEIERYAKFRQIVLQINGKENEISKEKKVDLRSYDGFFPVLVRANPSRSRSVQHRERTLSTNLQSH